jgi:hypothetical protein
VSASGAFRVKGDESDRKTNVGPVPLPRAVDHGIPWWLAQNKKSAERRIFCVFYSDKLAV